MTTESCMLQYVPIQSFVESSFWFKLDEMKLDEIMLSDDPRPIYGFYNVRGSGSNLHVDYSSFNSDFTPPRWCFKACGTLYNKNTIEDFKQCSKQELLALEGKKLLNDFKTGRVLDNPSLLARFFTLSFADIKTHSFYYWFAFPCPLTTTLELIKKPKELEIVQQEDKLPNFIETLTNMPTNVDGFFVLKISDPSKIHSLKAVLSQEEVDVCDVFFCFADPNDTPQPTWFMRTYAAYVYYKRPELICKAVNFIGIRFLKYEFNHSMVYQVYDSEPMNFDDEAKLKFVGWERNRNERMGPRIVNLQEQMDPKVIVENSLDLNLKLMKWRLVPDLNLEEMKKTKCLLFGAGTLGCAVARNLLSWGFRHITFIDNGSIGYSNPVRQNLYLFDDATTGRSMKATTAAKRLRDINPNVVTNGHVMQIPMPGHTIGELLLQDTIEDLAIIEDLIESHDAIFLLTDSRESRWLPTLLGAVHNKIVMTAALGFDSYLVMRHGNSADAGAEEDGKMQSTGNLKCINGSDLGCYFCNDVTAPGNSQKDRTLDQQCTVTRPGVSNIAASYVVELLVSLLQHPLKKNAPAFYRHTGTDTCGEPIPEGILGIIPHSIRGNLYDFQNMLPATVKFEQCIACSKRVLDEYKEKGKDFLIKVFETTKYLEDLTGISAYKDLDSTVIDFDEADLEETSEESV